MIKLLNVASICFYFIGCSEQRYLGENYYYLPVYEALDMGYPGGAVIYRSEQVNYFDDVKICGDVIDVEFDEVFVLAIQDPNQNVLCDKKTETYLTDVVGLNYWIIAKQEDIVYGPYSKEKFQTARIILKVPTDLTMRLLSRDKVV